MDSLHGRSVVDYVSPGETRRGHRCGYCKSSDGRINNGETRDCQMVLVVK
jgi:hypothetical protein